MEMTKSPCGESGPAPVAGAIRRRMALAASLVAIASDRAATVALIRAERGLQEMRHVRPVHRSAWGVPEEVVYTTCCSALTRTSSRRDSGCDAGW
jgi:hypothetical protein